MLVERAAAAAEPLIDVTTPYDEPTFPFGLTRRGDPVKGFVTIVEGCNDYCAYCVVPYTRGQERMRAKAEIVREVKRWRPAGAGKCSSSVRSSTTTRRPTIRRATSRRCSRRYTASTGIDRIRFASPHPRHCSPQLIAALRDLPKVCKHLHLPVQSGSSRVLKAMRRRHTREDYLDLVHSCGQPCRTSSSRPI